MVDPDPGERFSRKSRLQRKGEFRLVFDRGRRVRKGGFRAVAMVNDLGYPRLGLAVSRRIGGAVARNLVKRRLREVFRRNRQLFQQSVDVVVMPQPGTAELDFPSFQQQVLELFTRCGEAR